jgi:hypothetical protein
VEVVEEAAEVVAVVAVVEVRLYNLLMMVVAQSFQDDASMTASGIRSVFVGRSVICKVMSPNSPTNYSYYSYFWITHPLYLFNLLIPPLYSRHSVACQVIQVGAEFPSTPNSGLKLRLGCKTPSRGLKHGRCY